jgi:hypothetical protein
MDNQAKTVRTTARIIGALFLLATASSIAGFSIVESFTGAPDYLSLVYPDRRELSWGLIFHLVNDASVVGIGILMFGLFKKLNPNIATTILSTRLLEGGLLCIGKIGLLLLMTISKQYIAAGMPEASHFQTLGTLAIKWHAWSFEMAMIALGLGGVTLGWLLYSARLVPRWIAVLGVIGYVCLFTRSALSILGYPQGFALFAPVALFEFVIPVWLIFKGVNLGHINHQEG